MFHAYGIRSALLLVTVLAVFTTACKSKKEPSTEAQPATPGLAAEAAKTASEAVPAQAHAKATWYLVTLKNSGPEGDIPFYLSIPSYGSDAHAVLLQGPERTELPIAWSNSTHFEVDFGLLPCVLRAAIDPVGFFEGEWERNSGKWGDAKLALRAEPVDAPEMAKLFPLPKGAEPKPKKATGEWILEMNETGSVRLELFEENGSAHGALYFKSGNITAMAGQSMNGKLRLSGFDGSSGYLLEAEFADGETLTSGRFLAGAALDWKETFTGKKGEDFEVEGPSMKDPQAGISIEGFNLDAYKGKPLIIEMAGSWCITCRYAAPFLRTIYAEFHPKGLEMVTLAYEFTDDEAYNTKRAQDFKEEYEVDWEVVAVMGDSDSFADIMPTGLEILDVSGFPVSIFVGRDGAVTYIHAGFPGTKESEAYKTITKEYRAKVAELVAP